MRYVFRDGEDWVGSRFGVGIEEGVKRRDQVTVTGGWILGIYWLTVVF